MYIIYIHIYIYNTYIYIYTYIYNIYIYIDIKNIYNIQYIFDSNIETREKGVKYVQSSQ